MSKDPECISIPLEQYNHMVKCLVELSEDVIAYADAEYVDRRYPSIDRRWKRDTETAREVLGKYSEESK